MKIKLTLLIQTDEADAVRFFVDPKHKEQVLEEINENFFGLGNEIAIDCTGEQVEDGKEKL